MSITTTQKFKEVKEVQEGSDAMARPCKKRRICQKPQFEVFGPEPPTDRPRITMTLEEYECLRLLDYEGLTQEECAAQMLVARTTVQALYASARKRLTAALVEGRPLQIAGGSYAFCRDMPGIPCPFASKSANSDAKTAYCCHSFANPANPMTHVNDMKGDFSMKLAVTYNEANQTIFQHFGKTQAFKLYTIEDSKVVSSEVLPCNGAGHAALAVLLQQHGVDTLICGGIGAGAQSALANAGITLYGGTSGSADQAVEEFLAGKLNYDPAVHCSHHEHECHGGHGCGQHGHGQQGQHE
ncbi:DUF134 domain-containing protein [Mitsuokella sp.]